MKAATRERWKPFCNLSDGLEVLRVEPSVQQWIKQCQLNAISAKCVRVRVLFYLNFFVFCCCIYFYFFAKFFLSRLLSLLLSRSHLQSFILLCFSFIIYNILCFMILSIFLLKDEAPSLCLLSFVINPLFFILF